MSGSEFARQFTEWEMEKREKREEREKALNYHIVQYNPEKSKHLETASMRYQNFEIDFCGLRTEKYTSESRIPLISFGTPSEDAYRRDLTINSLFYNINTDQIEDFTQHGLKDLFDGRISTPLPPLVTLQDDPLRCLRIVRFANRFNFTITSDLAHACCDDSVRESLLQKVSQERISQELNQIISHPCSSIHGLPLLYQLSLLPNVLRTPHSISLYRIREKYPVNRLNWKLLWTPLPPSGYDPNLISEPVDFPSSTPSTTYTNAWVNIPVPGRSSPPVGAFLDRLLDSVQTDGSFDKARMCQAGVALGQVVYILLQSKRTQSNPDHKLLRYATLTYPCHEILYVNSPETEGDVWVHLLEKGLKKTTMIPLTQHICVKSLMLGMKDIDQIIRLQHAAFCVKPLLEQICLAILRGKNQSISSYVSSLLSSENITQDFSYLLWNITSREISERIVPIWGPLDRLSVGLILREIGSPALFQAAITLASSEMILDNLLSRLNITDDTSEAVYNKLIKFFVAITTHKNLIEDEVIQSEIPLCKEDVNHLILQSEKLSEIINYGIDQMNLKEEFQRHVKFTGHDLQRLLPHLPKSVYSEVLHEQIQYCLCDPHCTFDDMRLHLNRFYPNYRERDT